MTTFPNHLWRLWNFEARANRIHPGKTSVYWYVHLPGQIYLSWDMDADYDERLVWGCGKLRLTRFETDQEREEREEGEARAAAEERDLNRYVQWYY